MTLAQKKGNTIFENAIRFIILRGAALALTLGLASLAQADTGHPSFGEYKSKGFLTDYSKIKPVGGDSGAYRYEDPNADTARYNKVMIERIKIWLKPGSEDKGIDPTELKELVDYFHKAIVDAVQDAYPVVREAGPDVVRVRIAVTDVVPNEVSASIVTLVVPFLWVGDAGAGVAEGKAGSTPFVGQATIEMEALDSTTSAQLAAYVETRNSKKYNWTEGAAKGVDSYLKAYSTWDYTKQAMDAWAKLIRTRLDQAHGKAPKTATQ